MSLRCSACTLLIVLATPPASAEEPDGNDSGRLYSTREEQREAGLQRRLTPWLTLSGLAELEITADRFSSTTSRDYLDETDATVQIGLIATPVERLEAELITEYDTATDKVILEEATLTLEFEPWELIAGKQYLPFGVYFSHFATGPLIELGETRATAANLTYDHQDTVELSFSVYRGRAREKNSEDNGIDWALAIAAWGTDRLSLGLSYVSDLGDADARLLEDENDRFGRKIAGLSSYLLWVDDKFEVSLEALGAIRSFDELDADRNRPFAWNLEFVHFPFPRFDWALRLEGSTELEEAPRLQYGVAVNTRLHRRATLTVEALHGRFDGNLAIDAEDNPYAHVNHIGILLSVVF